MGQILRKKNGGSGLVKWEEDTKILGVAEKRLFSKYQSRTSEIKESYKHKMLSISREFSRNMNSGGLTRKDCQLLYDEDKKPAQDKFDKKMLELKKWYKKEKGALK